MYPKYAELFIDTLYLYREQKKYQLHSLVVMPEHLHLLITPLGITIERALQFIKGGILLFFSLLNSLFQGGTGKKQRIQAAGEIPLALMRKFAEICVPL